MSAYPDLGAPIRTALINNAAIKALLAPYKNSYAVFSRRPVPEDAEYPMITLQMIYDTDEDGINDQRPIINMDVGIWGLNNTPDDYYVIENLSTLVRDLFHRKREAITVPNWHVVDIRCRGPRIAPSDDDKITGRIVEVRNRLSASI